MENGIEEVCARRLRELRREKGLTLDQCEAMSRGAIKAVVLGSYERGNRAISLVRLQQLAEFYEVPLDYFLAPIVKGRERSRQWSFDLRALRNSQSQSSEIIAIKRLLNTIATQRQDWAGELLTIRESDGEVMESLLDEEYGPLYERLRENLFVVTPRN